MDRKTIISLLLIFASCVLLVVALLNDFSDEKSIRKTSPNDYRFITKGVDDIQNTVNLNEVFNQFNDLHSYDGLMLFVVDNDYCATCINEISEYLNESNSYINSSLNDLNIRGHTFVLGRDSTDLRLVERILNIPFSISLVKKESILYRDLSSIKSGHTGVNKVIFVSLSEEEITSIIRIFNQSTEVYVKRNLIRDALSTIQR